MNSLAAQGEAGRRAEATSGNERSGSVAPNLSCLSGAMPNSAADASSTARDWCVWCDARTATLVSLKWPARLERDPDRLGSCEQNYNFTCQNCVKIPSPAAGLSSPAIECAPASSRPPWSPTPKLDAHFAPAKRIRLRRKSVLTRRRRSVEPPRRFQQFPMLREEAVLDRSGEDLTTR